MLHTAKSSDVHYDLKYELNYNWTTAPWYWDPAICSFAAVYTDAHNKHFYMHNNLYYSINFSSMEPYSYDIEIQSIYPLQQLITTCSSFLLLILNLAVVHGNCSNTLTSTLIQNQLILLEKLVNVLDNVSKYRCCKSLFILFIIFARFFNKVKSFVFTLN